MFYNCDNCFSLSVVVTTVTWQPPMPRTPQESSSTSKRKPLTSSQTTTRLNQYVLDQSLSQANVQAW